MQAKLAVLPANWNFIENKKMAIICLKYCSDLPQNVKNQLLACIQMKLTPLMSIYIKIFILSPLPIELEQCALHLITGNSCSYCNDLKAFIFAVYSV